MCFIITTIQQYMHQVGKKGSEIQFGINCHALTISGLVTGMQLEMFKRNKANGHGTWLV